MFVQRDVRVLTIRIKGEETFGDTFAKGTQTEDEVWKGLVSKKDEVFKGLSFQDDKIVVCYEWEEGLSKDEAVRKALNWARDVVSKMFDDAEVLEVGE